MNIEQYESAILSLDCDLQRISVLERKSRARLQAIHRCGRRFIRSIADRHAHLRILLLALLIHALQHRGDVLRRVKEIVYGSALQQLTESRGLLREQLHKSVGVHLRRAGSGEGAENELVRCFNCVAFFDEVLLASFREHFLASEGDSFEHWQGTIWAAFGVEGEGLGVEREGEGVYLLSRCKEAVEEDTLVDRSQATVEQIEHPCHNLLTVSMDSLDSPCNKENRDPNPPIPAFKLSPSRSRRRPSSFWSVFCCGGD